MITSWLYHNTVSIDEIRDIRDDLVPDYSARRTTGALVTMPIYFSKVGMFGHMPVGIAVSEDKLYSYKGFLGDRVDVQLREIFGKDIFPDSVTINAAKNPKTGYITGFAYVDNARTAGLLWDFYMMPDPDIEKNFRKLLDLHLGHS